MVGWRELDINVKVPHDVLVQVCNKCIAIVADRGCGAAEPLDPAHQGFAALLAAGLRHGVALKPTTGPAKDTEQVSFTLGLRERTNYVQVNGGEALVRHGKCT